MLEEKIADLESAITKLTAVIESQIKTGSGSTPPETTTSSAKVEKADKTETAAAKKKRLASEKAAKDKKASGGKAASSEDVENEQPEDLKDFKTKLLIKVDDLKGKAPAFTKEFLSVNGFEAAAEVPEQEWLTTLDAFDTYIADQKASENDI